MTKDDICNAFCGQIIVRDVPAGLAVQTPFAMQDGDLLGFYVVKSSDSDDFRLEDAGLLVPMIEASGANLETGTRAKEFRALLDEYGAEYDSDSMEICSSFMPARDIPAAAVQFVAMLLRVQDLQLLRTDVVENTFKDDAKAAISSLLAAVADIEFDAPPDPELADYSADIVIRSKATGAAAAVYLGTTEGHVSEAVSAWLEAQLKSCSVKISMLCETEKPPVTHKLMRRASNRLDSVSFFRDDETAAIEKIARQIGLSGPSGLAPSHTKH
jgi:hypothetical protein